MMIFPHLSLRCTTPQISKKYFRLSYQLLQLHLQTISVGAFWKHTATIQSLIHLSSPRPTSGAKTLQKMTYCLANLPQLSTMITSNLSSLMPLLNNNNPSLLIRSISPSGRCFMPKKKRKMIYLLPPRCILTLLRSLRKRKRR